MPSPEPGNRPPRSAPLAEHGFGEGFSLNRNGLATPVRRQVGDRRLDLADHPGLEQATLQILAARFVLGRGMMFRGGIARVTRPLLFDLLKQQTCSFGHRVIDR